MIHLRWKRPIVVLILPLLVELASRRLMILSLLKFEPLLTALVHELVSHMLQVLSRWLLRVLAETPEL